MIVRRTCLVILFALSACSLTATTSVPQVPTATTVRVIPATIVPTVSRQMNSVQQPPESTGSPEATEDNCQATAGQPAISHTVVANLNYAQRAAIVRQHVRYLNRSNDALDELVMGVEANQWPNAFKLNSLIVDDLSTGYELTGRRLTVDLPQPLEPGCTVLLDLEFQLNVPLIGGGITAYEGYFGHSPRQMNLGNWLPVVAPRLNGEWLLREAVMIGEQTVADVADWDVTLNVSGAQNPLVIAGPGRMNRMGDHQWRFEVAGLRDFTLSLSDEFHVLNAQTESGVTVEVFSFDDALVTLEDGTLADGAEHALDVAVRSVAMYEDLFGPYPYERLAVVEGDFPDGMEFSGLVFVSKDWFERFNGTPASWLTVITVHEVAHQWWYAAVGNDQAMSPWLDEALATYSEYVYFEEFHPDLKEWWWGWRVDNYAPQGKVDTSVYEYASIREYINSVYLLGARMLHDLRTDLGTEAFFDFLRRYHESSAGRIADADTFWATMSADELAATLTTRLRYFRHAGPGQ